MYGSSHHLIRLTGKSDRSNIGTAFARSLARYILDFLVRQIAFASLRHLHFGIINNMSLTNEEQLKVALQAQSSRGNDPGIAERICEEIKQSTVFRQNWQALLQSAPVAISATGACYAACFSEAGQRVTLNLPLSGQFKYLEYRSLSANLLACGDRGRFAFLEAETRLAFVKDVSTRAENKVSYFFLVVQSHR